MSNKNKINFMDSIYDVLNTPEPKYEDGIIYLDEPVDEFGFDTNDDLAWADEIIYLDDPEEESFNYDLGEGYIPLPQGNVEEIQSVVIDENYILDEFESDITEGIAYIDDVEEMSGIIEESKTKPVIDIDNAESIIKLPGESGIHEELSIMNLSSEDDKISKAIAREYMENSGIDSTLLGEEYIDPSDDTSWVDSPDLFGNDIDSILAEDPDSEIEDVDYVDGSFEDWIAQNAPIYA